jgi:antitoxin ParD1/3/4
MGQVSKMSIAVTPEMAALVTQAVESGEYASNSEVIREALREWKQRRSLAEHDRERLQDLWAEGLASGPGRFENMAAIKAEARRRLLQDQPKVAG